MGTFFCPYLGRDVDGAEGSDEHVVPESLGGSRDLLIRVETKTNSDLGSSVDAEANRAYSNRRVQHDLRGKSGSEPKVMFPRYVWARVQTVTGVQVVEARLTNRDQGHYKGYFVDADQDLPGRLRRQLVHGGGWAEVLP